MSSLFNIILNYFKYISGYLWSYLADSKDVKSIDRGIYIIAIGIGNTCAKNTYIKSIYTTGTWIRCIGVKDIYTKDIYIKNAFIGNIKLKVLVRLEII